MRGRRLGRRSGAGLLVAVATGLALAFAGAPSPAAAAEAGGSPAAAKPKPLFRILPFGYPTYAPNITDYVTRCAGVGPVRVYVTAPRGTRVSVAGRAARSGSFTVDVPLAFGQAFTITTRTGTLRRARSVRCLPGDFPLWTVNRRPSGTQQWYLVAFTASLTSATPAAPPPYTIIFDRFGTPVWWLRTQTPTLDAELFGATLALSRPEAPYFFGLNPSSAFELRRLDGTVVRTIQGLTSPIDSHEIELHLGNWAYSSYRPRGGANLSPYGGPPDATVFDAVIEEVAPDGRLVWSWDSKDHIALDEYSTWLPTVLQAPAPLPDGSGTLSYDVAHANSIDFRGDFVLLSLRHANAIYKIRRSTGEIVWKLGGTKTPRSLEVRNDVFGFMPLAGQHDARMRADGTVTVYDNGLPRSDRPRAVQYGIDDQRRTATLVDEQPASTLYPSLCCGSARKLGNGGWLVSWGGLPTVDEFDRQGRVVFNIGLAPFSTYRVQGLPFGQLSRAALIAGMNTMYAG